MSGIDRRGDDIRKALAGEQPVRPRLVVEVEPPAPSPFRRRDPRLLVAALLCALVVVGCLALLVWGAR